MINTIFLQFFSWLQSVFSWVWNYILSIRIVNVPLWGWLVAFSAIVLIFSLVLKFRPTTPDSTDAYRLARSVSRISRSDSRKGRIDSRSDYRSHINPEKLRYSRR